MTAGPGSGFTVLIVEDDPDQLEITRQTLVQQGFAATGCADARTAVRELHDGDHDVVLCDFRLPDLSGRDLLNYVRMFSQRTAFVMLTGVDHVPTAVQSMREGADEYLVKPMPPDALAGHLLGAIEHRRVVAGHLRTHRQAERAPFVGFFRTVQSLVNSLETMDRYTHGHSVKVAGISLMMGRAMGLPRTRLREIKHGALLHDIGKIGIPVQILHKQGPLSAAEWATVKMHPLNGHRILAPLAASFPEVQRIVRHEHERWDGNGYPDGLAGTAIPLGARLVMVADTYDAICSTRPYRQALSKDDAREVVRAGAGSQFDPDLVPVFERVLPELPAPREA